MKLDKLKPLGYVINAELKTASDLDALEECLRHLRMDCFPETLSWIHETPSGRKYEHSDKARAELDRQLNGGKVYPAWMPADTKPAPKQPAPAAPAKQPPCPSLVTDVHAAVLRLLTIPEDLCHDAERAERTHRQAEFTKALSAVSQALGLEPQTVTLDLEGPA